MDIIRAERALPLYFYHSTFKQRESFASFKSGLQKWVTQLQSESRLPSMKELFLINNTFYHKKLSEGNLTEICQKIIFPALFNENPLRSNFRDTFSLETDILDPYDSVWLKLATILVYCVEIAASIVMVAFVAFETQGFAGHYRTLINQLLSYLYGGVRI